MTYKRDGIIFVIFLVIGTTICLNVFDENARLEHKYSRYLILNQYEDEYLDNLKKKIEEVYKDNKSSSSASIKVKLSKYMTSECADKFAKDVEIYIKNKEDLKANVKEIHYVYGTHQDDGVSKIFGNIELSANGTLKYITLEMKLGKDNLIYEVNKY